MWRDRILGIALGLVLGVALVAVFVFVFSEDTIDSASVAPGASARDDRGGERAGDRRSPTRSHRVEADVAVVGGAPPESGPAHVDARRGDHVTLTVDSDATVTLSLTGYGITRSVAAATPTPIAFEATRVGNFALINTATHIAVAQLRVDPG